MRTGKCCYFCSRDIVLILCSRVFSQQQQRRRRQQHQRQQWLRWRRWQQQQQQQQQQKQFGNRRTVNGEKQLPATPLPGNQLYATVVIMSFHFIILMIRFAPVTKLCKIVFERSTIDIRKCRFLSWSGMPETIFLNNSDCVRWQAAEMVHSNENARSSLCSRFSRNVLIWSQLLQ